MQVLAGGGEGGAETRPSSGTRRTTSGDVLRSCRLSPSTFTALLNRNAGVPSSPSSSTELLPPIPVSHAPGQEQQEHG